MTSVSLSRDGLCVLISSLDNNIRLLDKENGELLNTLARSPPLFSLFFLFLPPLSLFLFLPLPPCSFSLPPFYLLLPPFLFSLPLIFCHYSYRFKDHRNTEYKIDSSLTHDDSHIVSGSEDGKIYFWDLVEVSELYTTAIIGKETAKKIKSSPFYCKAILSLSFRVTV